MGYAFSRRAFITIIQMGNPFVGECKQLCPPTSTGCRWNSIDHIFRIKAAQKRCHDCTNDSGVIDAGWNFVRSGHVWWRFRWLYQLAGENSESLITRSAGIAESRAPNVRVHQCVDDVVFVFVCAVIVGVTPITTPTTLSPLVCRPTCGERLFLPARGICKHCAY